MLSRIFAATFAALALVASLLGPSPADARTAPVRLTEELILGMVAYDRDLAEWLKRLQAAAANPNPGPPPPGLVVLPEQRLAKHGFTSLEHHRSVAATIITILLNTDEKTGAYTFRPQDLAASIAAIERDQGLTPQDRAMRIADLRAHFDATDPKVSPDSIALVKKHEKLLRAHLL